MATRFVSVIGLGFGDCGKGRFVDELCPLVGAHTVVRYNGGAQAGHTVVLPDGRHHIFSSFGAGSFHPGVATLLAHPVVVHPTGLLREAERLAEKGAADPLARLTIDARCRVTTPYLQAAGRLRELSRAAAHGSCGVGFGETVKLSLEKPELSLAYGDLADRDLCREKLEAQRAWLPGTLGEMPANEKTRVELAFFAAPGLTERWLEAAAPLFARVAPAGHEQLAERLRTDGGVIFEGAQGMLLDEDWGFHPHTTWSRVGPEAAEAVLRDAGISEQIWHLGALRPYLTRHGQGPLPTEDPALDRLAEPHNASTGWQGRFRRGHPDQLLLRYALEAAGGKIAGLLVSHRDVLLEEPSLRWCVAYDTPEGRVDQLDLAAEIDLGHQAALTELLCAATPVYGRDVAKDPRAWVDQLEAIAGPPAVLGSYGPRRGQIELLRPLPA